MEKSRARWAATNVIFFVVQLILLFVTVSCIDDKCAACNAVAEELEIGLLNEKPRNHLDLRNRLNSKGQREGKVIDYRVSELRVVELLDGLCEKMQDYTLDKSDSIKHEWVKVDDWGNLTIGNDGTHVIATIIATCDYPHPPQSWRVNINDKPEARAYSKDISSYCGRLLEETEDELAELIKKGSVGVGDVSRVLCQDLSGLCRKSSGGSDGEL